MSVYFVLCNVCINACMHAHVYCKYVVKHLITNDRKLQTAINN